MKKRIFAALMAAVIVFSFTACGKGGNKVDNESQGEQQSEYPTVAYFEIGGKNHVEIKDHSEYVKLGDYTGLDIAVTPLKTKEELKQEFDKYVEELLKENPKQITEGTVKDTDTVNMDFTGKIGGEPFSGGNGSDYTYKIHGGFIESLDKQLVGLECGKEYDLECKFPDDYKTNSDLAGKEAVFTVKINYIHGEPSEWTDDFVKTLTKDQYSSTAEFEESFIEYAAESDKNAQQSAYTSGIWTAILSNSDVKGYPDDKYKESVDQYFDTMKANIKSYAENYGIEYEEMLVLYGYKTEDDLKKYCEDRAKQELDYIMLACLIANKENIAVTDEIYMNMAESIYKGSGFSSLDDFEEKYGVDYIMESFVFEAVSAWIEDKNKLVESAELATTAAADDKTTAADDKTTAAKSDEETSSAAE